MDSDEDSQMEDENGGRGYGEEDDEEEDDYYDSETDESIERHALQTVLHWNE